LSSLWIKQNIGAWLYLLVWLLWWWNFSWLFTLFWILFNLWRSYKYLVPYLYSRKFLLTFEWRVKSRELFWKVSNRIHWRWGLLIVCARKYYFLLRSSPYCCRLFRDCCCWSSYFHWNKSRCFWSKCCWCLIRWSCYECGCIIGIGCNPLEHISKLFECSTNIFCAVTIKNCFIIIIFFYY
jgi:hypothetical protein